MGVHDIEMTDVILGLKEMPDEGTAHFLNFLQENRTQAEGAVMIPDSIDLVRASRPVAGPCKDVQFMPPPLQCRRQFRYVRGNPTHGLGVKRFP